MSSTATEGSRSREFTGVGFRLTGLRERLSATLRSRDLGGSTLRLRERWRTGLRLREFRGVALRLRRLRPLGERAQETRFTSDFTRAPLATAAGEGERELHDEEERPELESGEPSGERRREERGERGIDDPERVANWCAPPYMESSV